MMTDTRLHQHFDFQAVQYPAFVVVYGRSKHSITRFNRSEYDEQFACDYCQNADEAMRLVEGYPGHPSDMKVYVASNPSLVGELVSNGVSASYDREWDREDCDSCYGCGFFKENGEPSINRNDRMCLDCRGTGKAG